MILPLRYHGVAQANSALRSDLRHGATITRPSWGFIRSNGAVVSPLRVSAAPREAVFRVLPLYPSAQSA